MQRLRNGCPLRVVSAVQSQAFGQTEQVTGELARAQRARPDAHAEWPLPWAPPPSVAPDPKPLLWPAWILGSLPGSLTPPSSLHSLTARSQPTRQCHHHQADWGLIARYFTRRRIKSIPFTH